MSSQHEFRELLGIREYVGKLILEGRREGVDELHRFLAYCGAYMMQSSAQLFQDLLVTYLLKGKRDGYFVEFGATDGVLLSNTLLLERQFGWKGILAEPAKAWHEPLKRNRKSIIDTRCIWSRSGDELDFIETSRAELSTVSSFTDSDHKGRERQSVSSKYRVQTVSLNDLLKEHSAPPNIDYLSLDTEGSEKEILSNFDFKKYRFSVMTIETNNRSEWRDELVTEQGYRRIFPEISLWDAWYVLAA